MRDQPETSEYDNSGVKYKSSINDQDEEFKNNDDSIVEKIQDENEPPIP